MNKQRHVKRLGWLLWRVIPLTRVQAEDTEINPVLGFPTDSVSRAAGVAQRCCCSSHQVSQKRKKHLLAAVEALLYHCLINWLNLGLFSFIDLTPGTMRSYSCLRSYSSAGLAALKDQVPSVCWHWQRCFPPKCRAPWIPLPIQTRLVWAGEWTCSRVLRDLQGDTEAHPVHPATLYLQLPRAMAAQKLSKWQHSHGNIEYRANQSSLGVPTVEWVLLWAQRFEAEGEHLFPPKSLFHNFKRSLDA